MIKEFKHGKNGYSRYKCRCDICIAGKKEDNKKHKNSLKCKAWAADYRNKNREKMNLQHKEWKARNKQALSLKYKEWRLNKIAIDPLFDSKRNVRRYGIDLSTYNLMLDRQNGHCACCPTKPGEENGNRKLAVDHNHITGKVRGLLCGKCNSMIGYAKEDRARLLNAIDYLERHKN